MADTTAHAPSLASGTADSRKRRETARQCCKVHNVAKLIPICKLLRDYDC
jgi:hypothetical protein